MKRIFCFLSLISFSPPTAANALEIPTSESVHVHVRAPKIHSSLESTDEGTFVISKEAIEQKQNQNITDLLRGVPGTSLKQTGGNAQQAFVSIRGAKTADTLILDNGVPQKDSLSVGGNFNLALVPSDAFSKIEIYRGPHSAYYGSGATGGVLSLITDTPTEPMKTSLLLEGGSYTTLKEAIRTKGRHKDSFFDLHLTQINSKGFSAASSRAGNTEADGFSTTQAQATLGLQRENFSPSVAIRYQHQASDLDVAGGRSGDDPNYTAKGRTLSIAPKLELKWIPQKWEQTLGFVFLDQRRNYLNTIDSQNPSEEDSRYKSQSLGFDWRHRVQLAPQSRLTLGVNASKTDGEFSSENQFQGFKSTQLVSPSQQIQKALYLRHDQDLGSFHHHLALRWDRFQSPDEDNFSFRLAPSYEIPNTGSLIRGSLGSGFRVPSLFQLHSHQFGNSQLQSEKVLGWDIGFEQKVSRDVKLGANYFENTFRNRIDFQKSRYINLSRAQTQGVEFYSQIHPTRRLEIFQSYSLTFSKDLTQQEPLIGIPRHQTQWELHYLFSPRWQSGLQGYWSSKRLDFNAEPPFQKIALSSYWVADLFNQVWIRPDWKIWLRVQNIFDRRYEEVAGYGTPSRTYTVGTGVEI